MGDYKEKVGKPTGEMSTVGRPIYKTSEGEMVSEQSTTFKYKGKWINIPTIHNGYSYNDDELRLMLDHDILKPTSTHKNIKAAEKAAEAHSSTLRNFAQGGLTSHPSAMTADQYYDAEAKRGVKTQTEEALGLSSVPFFERPMDADITDKQVGGFEEDENPIFKTISGNTYTVSLNPDQRTTRTKIEEDIIPAVKKFADDPRFPTMDEVVGAGTAVAKGAYETASIPIDLLTGKRSITDVKMQDAFDIVGGVATGSLLFPGIPEGATRMFGGTSAYNLDTSTFAKAEELLKQNVDIENIRKETGWFLNEKDGKWRFEFDDSQMQFDTESSFKNKLSQQGKTFGQASVRLDEYINHPELFKLYPQLAEMRINPFYNFSDTSLGDYNPRAKFLRLSINSSEKEKKATVLHEIQHAIQDIEGHGSGYNPQKVQDSIVDTDPSSIALEAKLNKAWKIVNAQNNIIEDLILPQVVDSYGTRPDGSTVALVNYFDPISQTMNQKPAWTATKETRLKIENLVDDFKTPFGTVNKKNVLKSIKNYGSTGTNLLSKLSDKDIMKLLDKIVLKIPSKEKFIQLRKDEKTNISYVKHIYYTNAAGEIESDLVTERMDLSMKQREKNSPLVQAREIEKKNNSLLKPTWLQKLGLSANIKDARLSERFTRNSELFSTREGTDKVAYDTVFRKDSQDINIPLPLNQKNLMDPLTQVYDIDVARVAAIKPLVNWLKSKPSLEKVGNMSKGDKVNFGNGDYEFDKWEFSEVDVNTIPRGTTEFFADRTTLRTSADDKVYVPYATFTNGGRYPIDVLLDQTPLGKTIDPTNTAGLRGNTTNVKFAEGGLTMNQQTQMAFALGGEAETRDPVSGNDIPPGSLPVEVRDDIPARLSEGEYVVPADVVRFFGVKFFEDIRMEAKKGLQQMDVDGRIGGDPVPPQVQMAQAPEQDIDAMIDAEMATMNEGGLMSGYAPGGSVEDRITTPTVGRYNSRYTGRPFNYGYGNPLQAAQQIIAPSIVKPVAPVPVAGPTEPEGGCPQGYMWNGTACVVDLSIDPNEGSNEVDTPDPQKWYEKDNGLAIVDPISFMDKEIEKAEKTEKGLFSSIFGGTIGKLGVALFKATSASDVAASFRLEKAMGFPNVTDPTKQEYYKTWIKNNTGNYSDGDWKLDSIAKKFGYKDGTDLESQSASDIIKQQILERATTYKNNRLFDNSKGFDDRNLTIYNDTGYTKTNTDGTKAEDAKTGADRYGGGTYRGTGTDSSDGGSYDVYTPTDREAFVPATYLDKSVSSGVDGLDEISAESVGTVRPRLRPDSLTMDSTENPSTATSNSTSTATNNLTNAQRSSDPNNQMNWDTAPSNDSWDGGAGNYQTVKNPGSNTWGRKYVGNKGGLVSKPKKKKAKAYKKGGLASKKK